MASQSNSATVTQRTNGSHQANGSYKTNGSQRVNGFHQVNGIHRVDGSHEANGSDEANDSHDVNGSHETNCLSNSSCEANGTHEAIGSDQVNGSQQLVVTICTYNERENIAKLLPEVLKALPSAHVLVVDDNSPDGTANVVRTMMADDKRINLLLRTKKEGLGAATLAGFQWAIDNNYEFVLNMDADFSHSPKYLPAISRCMEIADVGIGSRYVPGGGITGWPFLRHCMSRGINWYSHVLLGIKANDCSGAFRCYRVSKLRELDFSKIRSRGYSFQEEFLYRCVRNDCRVVETPIVFEDRIVGQSKINVAEIIRSLRDLFLTGLEGIRETPVTHD